MVGDFVIIASACVNSGSGDTAAPELSGAHRKSCGGLGPATAAVMMECRICQEEGDDLESPCACNGTLKFAHRKCIQRWCNKKGNITCEICNQIFAPNYLMPPTKSNSDMLAIDIRQIWDGRIDVHDPSYLAFAAAEQGLLHAEYENYAAANSSGNVCCRTVALILMVLLLIHHILLVTRDSGMFQEASPMFSVSLLQFLGFFLPCYVIVRSCYTIQCWRRRQV